MRANASRRHVSLTCRNTTSRYPARRNGQAWHARGQGFESPKLHVFAGQRPHRQPASVFMTLYRRERRQQFWPHYPQRSPRIMACRARLRTSSGGLRQCMGEIWEISFPAVPRLPRSAVPPRTPPRVPIRWSPVHAAPATAWAPGEARPATATGRSQRRGPHWVTTVPGPGAWNPPPAAAAICAAAAGRARSRLDMRGHSGAGLTPDALGRRCG
jgi:hypothetical protein